MSTIIEEMAEYVSAARYAAIQRNMLDGETSSVLDSEVIEKDKRNVVMATIERMEKRDRDWLSRGIAWKTPVGKTVVACRCCGHEK